MAKANERNNLNVTFVDLKETEEAPCFAAYRLDNAGNPIEKLGRYDGKELKINFGKVSTVAFGPDIEEFKTLPRESLISYRVAQ